MKLPLLLACIALASVAGCEQEAVSPDALQLVSASVTPDGSVGATDSIAFTVTTFNPSGRAIEFPTGRPFAFDMIVNTPDRSVIWRLLSGAFGSPATPFSIAPGQSDTWTAVWWLEDLNGDRVPAGSYSVIGIIGQDLNAPILETEPLEILVAAPGGCGRAPLIPLRPAARGADPDTGVGRTTYLEVGWRRSRAPLPYRGR